MKITANADETSPETRQKRIKDNQLDDISDWGTSYKDEVKHFIDEHYSRVSDCIGLAPSTVCNHEVIVIGGNDDLSSIIAFDDYFKSHALKPIYNFLNSDTPVSNSDADYLFQENPELKETTASFSTPENCRRQLPEQKSPDRDLEERIQRKTLFDTTFISEKTANAHLFIFGSAICKYVQNSASDTFSPLVLKLLAHVFQQAKENSVFVFIDLMDQFQVDADRRRSKPTKFAMFEHVEKVCKKYPHLSLSQITGRRRKLSRARLFCVWKSYSYKLPDSFYSTVSYLRSKLLAVDPAAAMTDSISDILAQINHSELLNIKTLMKSSKYSDENVELDEATATTYLRVLRLLSAQSISYGSLESMETALKRCILINWFLHVYKHIE